jgi:hypothetical protein
VLYCRTSNTGEPSKAAEQKPVGVLATASVTVASAPPPLEGVGLTTCTYNDARSSAQRVFWYLKSLKNAAADQEGNRSSFIASYYLSTACYQIFDKD